MLVRFNQDRTTKTRKEDQQEFKKGEVYDLPDSSARHWITRGVAEHVEDESKVRPRTAQPKEPAGEKEEEETGSTGPTTPSAPVTPPEEKKEPLGPRGGRR